LAASSLQKSRLLGSDGAGGGVGTTSSNSCCPRFLSPPNLTLSDDRASHAFGR